MPLSTAALEPVLRLALLEGVGPSRLAALVRHFGSAERALTAPARELEALPGVSPAVARRVAAAGAAGAGDGAVRRALRRIVSAGAVALTPDDLAFPDAFRLLPDPPFLLFAAGDLSLLGAPAVAVVGTRAPTEYGRAATLELAGALAGAGYTIVSGMARGVDTLAHRAALEAGGSTVGVLGHGIEQVYPPENRALFDAARAGGLLITEFLPGETPKAGNFPRRNRLIVALSRAVLVVEMGLKSGAQHTVTYALEQGKEVLAVPGPISSPASAGTNQLIKDGARLVTSATDVLEELEGVGAERPRPLSRSASERPQPSLPLLTALEASALEALAPHPRHVDELGAATGLGAGALLGVLLELEMKGLAIALPGKQYQRG